MVERTSSVGRPRQQRPKTVIILAGGLGTRLRPVVPDLPKPMAPVNGRPFLDYILKYWIRHGIDRAIISVGYMAEVIRKHYGEEFHGVAIDFAFEACPLGTGGGLINALDCCGTSEPVFVCNGDTYFDIDPKRMLAAHTRNSAAWTMALRKSADAKRYSTVQVSRSGFIVAIGNRQEDVNQRSELVNGGIYLVDPLRVRSAADSLGMPFSLEDDLLPLLLEQDGKVVGIEYDAPFIDIGVPVDYERAGEVVGNG